MASDFVVETSNAAEFPRQATFDDMGLPENLLRGIYAYGFEKPSAIQSVAILPLVRGRDVLGQAQSGTGKTGTFGIGLLSRIDPTIRATQALVLAHTHELAEQNFNVIREIGKFMKINVVLAVGGIPRHINARETRNGAHIVVGTPGRVYDLAQSGDLRFNGLRTFVLDEADEMLRDRFAEQVGEIVKIGLPESCRVAFFSATMPDEVRELADSILHDPVRVTLKTADVKLEGIRQFYVTVDEDSWKLDCLCDIFEGLSIPQSIIFTNTKERAERLHHALTERGFPVSVIYGEPMTQTERKKRMDDFRRGTTRVLIATNLLARGIDVQQVSLVFNFDIPPFEDKENYIHRIGRCGRFGRKGTAISLLTPAEKDVLDQIGSHYDFKTIALPGDLKGVIE
ncbi:DEAD/DEAH box helicase [bacterium]|nr:DEAD/DEAH box helicase [bacterium]